MRKINNMAKSANSDNHGAREMQVNSSDGREDGVGLGKISEVFVAQAPFFY